MRNTVAIDTSACTPPMIVALAYSRPAVHRLKHSRLITPHTLYTIIQYHPVLVYDCTSLCVVELDRGESTIGMDEEVNNLLQHIWLILNSIIIIIIKIVNNALCAWGWGPLILSQNTVKNLLGKNRGPRILQVVHFVIPYATHSKKNRNKCYFS